MEREIAAGTEFIFAHLHQIDDCGHTYGPYGCQDITSDKRDGQQVWPRICENFSGHMLLISDHGMHAEAGGRELGRTEEDMLAVWGIPLKTDKTLPRVTITVKRMKHGRFCRSSIPGRGASSKGAVAWRTAGGIRVGGTVW